MRTVIRYVFWSCICCRVIINGTDGDYTFVLHVYSTDTLVPIIFLLLCIDIVSICTYIITVAVVMRLCYGSRFE